MNPLIDLYCLDQWRGEMSAELSRREKIPPRSPRACAAEKSAPRGLSSLIKRASAS